MSITIFIPLIVFHWTKVVENTFVLSIIETRNIFVEGSKTMKK